MTDISRRRVIGTGVAAIAAGALGVGVPLAGAPAARATDPTYTAAASLYRRSRFSSLRGQWFGLSGGGSRIAVRLIAVDDLPSEAAGSESNFRLTFTCRSAGPEQGTYTLRRSGWTTTSLFVVPKDDQRRTYTAIINAAR